MLAHDVVSYFQGIAGEPADPRRRGGWLDGDDILPFLDGSVSGDVPVYFNRPDFFLCVVLVPEDRLDGDPEEDLMRWNLHEDNGWTSMPHRREDGTVVAHVHDPGHLGGSTTLADAEFVTFRRHFARRIPKETYRELNQKLAHLTDVHWLAGRGAYCRLDGEGDIVEAVRFSDDPGDLVTVDGTTLHRYLVATGQAAVRLFDAGRVSDPRDADDGTTRRVERVRRGGVVAERLDVTGARSGRRVAFRGYQVLRPPAEPGERMRLLRGADDEDERQHPFLIQELKNRRVRRYPAGDDSDDEWPELISPAYFHPRVLDRYKADPDKYELTQTTIERRGGWFLRSYDVNAAGQVYVYLKDLWSLPYREQKHWALHNEAPKADITDRSIAQDFLAQPWLGPDAVRELQWLLRDFPVPTHDGVASPIWEFRTAAEERALSGLLQVHTGSRAEWGNQVLVLVKVVVEGLNERPIRAVARALGRDNKDWKSIKLLKECLIGLGLPDDAVSAIHDPLYGLNRHRSSGGVAHAGGTPTNKDLRQDFRDVLAGVATAMASLADLIRTGRFDLPLHGHDTNRDGEASPRPS